MHDTSIENIIRIIKTVGPEDTIGRATEALRVSGVAELPVISSGRVVGVIDEAGILNAITAGDSRAIVEQPVSTIMSDRVICVNPYMSVGQVAEIMRDYGIQVVPVIGVFEEYLGVVTRSDITGALCLTIRPPNIAGLATPIGVYLTTGNLRAGAGNLGLFLAGVVMVLMMFAAAWIVFGMAWLVEGFTKIPLQALMQSSPGEVLKLDWISTLGYVMRGAVLPVWMLIVRLLPISGYHAAEHQVVHAIENGESLNIANVQAMPRVHPRCGTNIFAGVIVLIMMGEIFSMETAILITVLVLIFAWRTIGGWFQYYVTTRPPNSKQVESGIKAGESLLEKYRENPGYRVNGWQRIWNTGMPQVMFGASMTITAVQSLNAAPPGLF